MPRVLTDKEAVASLKKAGLIPLAPYPGCSVPWLSKCLRCNNQASPRLGSVRAGQKGCKKCKYIEHAKKATRSQSEAKTLLRKANLIPLVPYPGAGKPWLAKCKKCKREVSPRLAAILLGQGGCKYCRYEVVSKKLALSLSEVAITLRKAGVKEVKPYPGDIRAHWEVECLSCCKRLKIRVSHLRVSKIKACANCRSSDKFKIKDKVAKLEMIGFKAEPLEKYPGDSVKWKCSCLNCNKEIYPIMKEVRGGRNPCRYCSYSLKGITIKEIYASEKDKRESYNRTLDKFKIQEEWAIEEMVKFGARPTEPYPGADERWHSVCLKCQREVYPRLSKVRGGTNPCQSCAYVLTGLRHRNDSEECRLEMLEAGFTPLLEYPGINKAWLSTCNKCGNEAKPRLGSIRRGQGGCLTCTHFGFNPADPAIVYMIQKENVLKVGIANTNSERVKSHERKGWTLLESLSCNNGRQALYIETAILHWFRKDLKAPVACTAKEMPQRGWTETISTDYVSPEDIWGKVKILAIESKDFKGILSENARGQLRPGGLRYNKRENNKRSA